MSKQPTDEYSEEEAARRRDEAIRRALNTPPQPRTGNGKAKRKTRKGSDRAGKRAAS
jgi:hypothetical protein